MNKLFYIYIYIYILTIAIFKVESNIVKLNYGTSNNILSDYSFSNTYISLKIDDSIYRESSIPINFDGIIAFRLNKINPFFQLIPNISNSYLSYTYYPSNKIIAEKHYLSDKIIDNTNLVNKTYYYDKFHTLYITYQIILHNNNNNLIPIIFNLLIDNKIKLKKKVYHTGISFFYSIKLERGAHTIQINTISNQIWCSCPSIKNGYNSGRYFFSWIDSESNSNINMAIMNNNESNYITNNIYNKNNTLEIGNKNNNYLNYIASII